MQNILFDENGTLKGIWRFLLFIFAFVAIYILPALTTGLILQTKTEAEARQFLSSPLYFLAENIFRVAAALFVGWLCARGLEKLPFSSLGAAFSSKSLRNFLIGSFGGAATFVLAALICVIFGGYRFALNETSDNSLILNATLFSLVTFLIAGAAEEALFRGYPFQTLERAGLVWLAILLTSVIFGLAHWQNPNASTFGIINTILAGIWFSAAYLKSRDLWFPFGLHWSWNFTMGSIFGVPVSGLTQFSEHSVIRTIDQGAVWLTGGHYGTEGGIACTAAIAAAILIIYFSKFQNTSADFAENPPSKEFE